MTDVSDMAFEAEPVERWDQDDSEYRSPFQRDRDRVLYSSEFRRLAGVTQVAEVREHALLHNRLTHSLKVAQLARSMATRVVENPSFVGDLAACREALPDVAETAGLTHDLGHPPFGHVGEDVLKRRMAEFGGFEGNAQSFRIVSHLARRDESNMGLNLTRASLNATLKYPTYEDGRLEKVDPWTDRSRGAKWGVYHSEAQQFRHARLVDGHGNEFQVHLRCVAAILMDWADDVSYGTHDLEDYYRAGLLPLHEIGRDEHKDEFRDFMVGLGKGFEPARVGQAYGKLRDAKGRPVGRYTDSRE